VLVNLVVCRCQSAAETAADEKGAIVYVDPSNTAPCGQKPLPNPSNPFINWDNATLSEEW
jgi:hypothetical protein